MIDGSEGMIDLESDLREFWVDVFNNNFNPVPGGVFALFGGYQSGYGRQLSKLAASYELVILSVTDVEEKSSLYARNYNVVANEDLLHKLQLIFKEQFEKLGNIDGAPEDLIEQYCNRVNFNLLPSSDSHELLTFLGSLPENSSVFIHCADQFRFQDIEADSLCQLSTNRGSQVRMNLAGEQGGPHYEELIRQTLTIAEERKLVVILSIEDAQVFSDTFINEMEKFDGLAMTSIVDNADEELLGELRLIIQCNNKYSMDEAFARIDKIGGSDFNIALAKAAVCRAKNLSHQAWIIIAPYADQIVQSKDINTLFGLAHIAYSAGKDDCAIEIAKQAQELEPRTLEQLNSLYLLWRDLGKKTDCENTFTKLQQLYPNSKEVKLEQFQRAFSARDFKRLRELSVHFGDSYHIAYCDFLSGDKLEVKSFLKEADRMGELNQALFDLAEEAYRRGRYRAAWRFLNRLNNSDKVVSFKFRVLEKRATQHVTPSQSMVDEFARLLQYVAFHAEDGRVRSAYESFLESQFAIVFLVATLDNVAMHCFQYAFENSISHEVPWLNASAEEDGKVSRCFEAILKNCPPQSVVGLGNFPEEAKDDATPETLYCLLRMLQEHADLSEENFVNLLLHAVCLISSYLDDPTSDAYAFRAVIARLCLEGEFQRARDVAETALIILSSTHPSNANWRFAMGWSCWADAYLRMNNTTSAIGALCLCFVAMGESILSVKTVMGLFRICSRALRDIRFYHLGKKYVFCERQLMEKYQLDKHLEYQLFQIEHSIESLEAVNKASLVDIERLLNEGIVFLEDEENGNDEIDPMLSTLITLLSRLKSLAVDVDEKYEAKIHSFADKAKSGLKELLVHQIDSNISRNYLIEKSAVLTKARMVKDLSYQIFPLRVTAEHAIAQAFTNQDIDLFITAACVLSQPVLSLSVSNNSKVDAAISSNDVNGLIYEHAKGSDGLLGEVVEAAVQLKEVSQSQIMVLDEVIDLTSTSIIQHLMHNESVTLLAHDSTGSLYRLDLKKKCCPQIIRLSPENWGSEKYREWKKDYPYAYGRWQPVFDPFNAEDPSIEDVQATLSELGIGVFDSALVNTIITDSELFGFPFGLLSEADSFYGQEFKIAKAPSLSWLLSARTTLRAPKKTVNYAWMGCPGHRAIELDSLDCKIRKELDAAQIQLKTSTQIEEFSGSSLCIVASHGGLNAFGEFATVSVDNRVRMGPSEVASKFNGCDCVVLLVCNAGRSDEQGRTSETSGMASALLRAGVRCVLAPAWPLSVEIAAIWTASFVDYYVTKKKNAGDAVKAASEAIRKLHRNPCAWSNMQLYGDYYLTN